MKHSNIQIALFLLMMLSAFTTSAQHKFGDTSVLNEVVVTATRTEKSIGDIPVPIQVISKAFIRQTGSQKLIEILQQQTGLVMADNPLGQALQGYPNPFGSGIQLQGLDPAYTLILVDGEPLTGRNAGILNLGRIAVGNIHQIEIVKGPSTSLFGSDALAGVINIITERPDRQKTEAQIHHASNNTWGFSASTALRTRKSTFQLFANSLRSSGYDLDKTIYGKTADPFHNFSVAAKAVMDLNENNRLQSSVRIFAQKQFNNYLVFTGTDPDPVAGTSKETDWSFNNQLTTKLSANAKLFTRMYVTGYRNDADVYLKKTNQAFDRSFMAQYMLKPEVQLELGQKKNQKFIAGIGYIYETINANRYTQERQFNAFYMFSQKEWVLKNKLNITVGARLDKHSLYDVQFNPKTALAYKVNDKFTVTGSIGTGFKAPDFRQQFLSFTNSLVGYTLFGANELYNGLELLQQQGQLDGNINISAYRNAGNLIPEKSVGINAGFRYRINPRLTISSNIFRNDIQNLIERFNLPFTKINSHAIFSYMNLNRVFTQGADLSIQHEISKAFTLNAGYQYLEAKDKDVVQQIRNKQMISRNPAPPYDSKVISMSDYGGLFNRSKHSANLQVAYRNEKQKAGISARAVYRGRFGFSDINGNNILDDDREYAAGYVMLNTTITKEFKKGISIQAGIDNLLDYTNITQLPSIPGRTYFINLNFQLQ